MTIVAARLRSSEKGMLIREAAGGKTVADNQRAPRAFPSVWHQQRNSQQAGSGSTHRASSSSP